MKAGVIPMADGYAQASNRPAFVNVHTMSGLGNALGALTNASANGTPLVVTAGQQHQNFLASDPLLSYDLVRFSEPSCKWAAQVQHVDELGTLLRRAFQDSLTPPTGSGFPESASVRNGSDVERPRTARIACLSACNSVEPRRAGRCTV